MRLSVSVKLLGRCLMVCLHWWSAREALLLLIHVARRSYIAIAYPPSCSWACFLVYRLHALHAGTALVIAYLCCRRDRLPLSRGNRSLRAGASCFSFLRNMLCDEGTICLRKECLSELLLETEFLVQTCVFQDNNHPSASIGAQVHTPKQLHARILPPAVSASPIC